LANKLIMKSNFLI